eukprot:GHVH01004595.1.p1 GENE.GHVH01004595.1~~GHVH01004595.1.p1  ORF type:complete len:405 (+),score=58.21 GHVH01004595.1:85-1299(+)
MAKKKPRAAQPRRGVSLTSELLNDKYALASPKRKAEIEIEAEDEVDGLPMTDRMRHKVLSVGSMVFDDDLDEEGQEGETEVFDGTEIDNEEDFICPESLSHLPDDVASYWMNFTGGNGADKIYESLRKMVESTRQERDTTLSVEQKTRQDEVEAAYSQMADILRRYKCGKLPKLLKMLPMIKEWEFLLSLTGHRKWTPQALYEITKIFASNAKQAQAQRFFNLFLLPAAMNEISKKGRVHICTYKSLMKAAFKCKAFMRGILLPLALDGCQYKEAMVIGSVVAKLSFPNDVLYMTLDKLLETRPFPDVEKEEPQWWAVTSIFICIIMEKTAQYPTPVIENAVRFIESFNGLSQRPPLIWYQGVIALCERYRDRLSVEQEGRIRAIVKQHGHPVVESIYSALSAK